MPRLPESFHLPTPAELDGTIEDVHQEIKAEGSALFYLGALRHLRRNSSEYTYQILSPLAKQALLLEKEDAEGAILDLQHHVANTALSGMIFGDVINQRHYPRIGSKYRPYNAIVINPDLLDSSMVGFIEAGGVSTPAGRQIGYSAVAGYSLQQLSDQSGEHIREWSHEVIHDPERRTVFMFGVGLAMYSAQFLYSELLIADGRKDEVSMAGVSPQLDSGND